MDRDLEHFKRYGWKCNEENLQSLPETAPEAARDLAKWLTLEGRRSSLQEWLGCVSEDGRIHGKFWNIGAWTHRMSHSAPNQANIPSVPDLSNPPRSAVEEIKHKYNPVMRECFTVPEGKFLVGTDAASIQLRILTHYMKSEVYKEAILSGDNDKGTDIHSVNMRALGVNGIDRSDAKTYIYAAILGAGLPKVASILRTNVATAKKAEQTFLERLPELKSLKQSMIPRDAMRGYFIGLDGRKVMCDSEHLMLAGYLQNGEAVIMKKWVWLWTRRAKQEGIDFKLVDFVHDEAEAEVATYEEAERLIKIQKECITEVEKELGLFCPLDVESHIGKTWRDVH